MVPVSIGNRLVAEPIQEHGNHPRSIYIKAGLVAYPFCRRLSGLSKEGLVLMLEQLVIPLWFL